MWHNLIVTIAYEKNLTFTQRENLKWMNETIEWMGANQKKTFGSKEIKPTNCRKLSLFRVSYMEISIFVHIWFEANESSSDDSINNAIQMTFLIKFNSRWIDLRITWQIEYE